MKRKKIAICISGYLRTFKECYPSLLENVIQDNDCDLFIHTYDTVGNSINHLNPIEYHEDIDMNFLQNIPNLKLIVTEKWDDIKYKFENIKKLCPSVTNISRFSVMFYKIYQCNELKKQYEKEHNFKYDLVIRIRGDLFFTKNINLDFPENKILINAYPWGDEDFVDHYQGHDENGNPDMTQENLCLNDRFAVGNSANIDYLTSLYYHFDTYMKELNNIVSPLEQLLYVHLKPIELERKNLFFYVNHFPPRVIKP